MQFTSKRGRPSQRVHASAMSWAWEHSTAGPNSQHRASSSTQNIGWHVGLNKGKYILILTYTSDQQENAGTKDPWSTWHAVESGRAEVCKLLINASNFNVNPMHKA